MSSLRRHRHYSKYSQSDNHRSNSNNSNNSNSSSNNRYTHHHDRRIERRYTNYQDHNHYDQNHHDHRDIDHRDIDHRFRSSSRGRDRSRSPRDRSGSSGTNHRSSVGHRSNITSPQMMATAALEAAQWTNRSSRNQETSEVSGQPSSHRYDSGVTISSLGTVNLEGVVYKKWPLPDITTYVLEEKSGFLYDHMTRYYYDPNSRYYYDSANTRYLYYDPKHQAYLPAEYLLKKTQEEARKGSKTEKKEENQGERQEKVKTATKVSKEMEKWAKTLNQKRDALKSSEVPTNTDNKSTCKGSPQQTKPKASSPKDDAPRRPSIDLKSLLKAEEDRLIDNEKLACLLCKRGFNSKELLSKHKDMSHLHASNLEKLKSEMFTREQIEECERHERETGYRDRAKERRERHGQPDDINDVLSGNKYLRDTEDHSEPSQSSRGDVPMGLDNKGASLMTKMGWKEGSGIGKTNQGMKDILKVEARVGKAGLGVKTYKHDAGTSYKEAVKQVMYQRYRDLAEDEN